MFEIFNAALGCRQRERTLAKTVAEKGDWQNMSMLVGPYVQDARNLTMWLMNRTSSMINNLAKQTNDSRFVQKGLTYHGLSRLPNMDNKSLEVSF